MALVSRPALKALSSVFQGKVAVMLTLASKLKRDDGLKGSRTSATASDSTRRVSVRDRLLVKGEAAHRWGPGDPGGSVGAGSSLWLNINACWNEL